MKIYIKSNSGFGKGWSREDIELYNTIDWAAIDYEPYPVEDDTIYKPVYLYGLPGYKMPITMPVKMQKYIVPNPIFSPYYAPVDPDRIRSAIPREYEDVQIVGPMAEGRTHNGYKIMDRYETYELNDRLSR